MEAKKMTPEQWAGHMRWTPSSNNPYREALAILTKAFQDQGHDDDCQFINQERIRCDCGYTYMHSNVTRAIEILGGLVGLHQDYPEFDLSNR